jgi:diguanylate cyclase (GGDEF)-like protein
LSPEIATRQHGTHVSLPFDTRFFYQHLLLRSQPIRLETSTTELRLYFEGRKLLDLILIYIIRTFAATQALALRGQLRMRERMRSVGIGSRLGISFGAVAILAIAANLTVEHGVSVIQTTRIFGANLIVRATPGASRGVSPSGSPLGGTVESPTPRITGGANFLDALGQFDRALTSRAQAATPENKALLTTTGQRLNVEGTRLISNTASTAPAGTAESMAMQMRALFAAGDALVNSSDARRASFAAHWSHFDGVDRLTKSALDQHWTIFGRVIARQSLVSLSRELDDIRRQAAQLTAAGGYEPSALDSLAQSEAKFSNTMRQNSAGLIRSQGVQWVEQLQKELAAMIADGTELAAADRKAIVAFNTFEQSVRSVGALARTSIESVRGSQAPKASVTESPDVEMTPPPAGPVSMPVPPPNSQPNTQRTSADFSGLARAIIAAISGVVLVLLLVVSITTVRSIVIPVRQFMATTARLVNGDAAARFERGGIREIDSLAISLNEMASTLEVAQAITREYQGALEVRIEERTRRLQHIAEHDLLTGLPNRRLLMKHLEETLRQAAAARMRVAVFFLDLDNFKNVNDSMGHTFGDRILQAVSQRLTLAATDSFVARLGGDEFTIVQLDTKSIEQVTAHGNNIVNAFQTPLLVEGRELLISISIGASIYPDHETSTEALLSAADAAVFHAKGLGRNQLSLFRSELLKSASHKFNTEQALRRALERNEFELVFQPEINFALGGIQLMEVLLRWRLPDGRRISPMQFLPTAQEAGLMNSIGDWVLRSAIESAARWHHGPWRDVRIAINVSASQLISKGFVQRVQELLLLHELPTQCIEIELTEAVLQNGPATLNTLRELRALDIAVALDDFGTGFSSLSSLQHLPLSRVKLDQSLIAAIDKDDRALVIANAIIDLCEKLGLAVTAEGIERPEQLHLLLEHHSICLQGYLISFPVESDAVAAVVESMPGHMQSLFLTASELAASKDTSVRTTVAEPASILLEFEPSKQA